MSVKRLASSILGASGPVELLAAGAAAKRGKEEPAPSRVLHLRGLPPTVSEHAVVTLLSRFGRIERILLMHKAKQALVQCESVAMATAVVTAMPFALIQSETVRIQYSQHQTLSIKPKESLPDSEYGNIADGPVVLLKVSNQLFVARTPLSPHLLCIIGPSSSACTIIDVHSHLFCPSFPVDLPTVQMLVSKFCTVCRIAIFVKSGQLHALVEASDSAGATAAIAGLHGQHMYDGCCMLHVERSKLQHLEIKTNTATHHDFTVAPLTRPPQAVLPGGTTLDAPIPTRVPLPPPALVLNSRGASAPMSRVAVPGVGSPVVLVSNLASTTPDEIAKLIGVYADVVRVKVLFKKPDTALVQLRDAIQLAQVIQHLSGVTFRGKVLQIQQSKHREVSLPLVPDELTKDYTSSRDHRFSPTAKPSVIHAPSRVLHISSMPHSAELLELKELMARHGTIVGARRFEDRAQALVELDTISNALDALVALHGTMLTPGGKIRVSFSGHKSAV